MQAKIDAALAAVNGGVKVILDAILLPLLLLLLLLPPPPLLAVSTCTPTAIHYHDIS